MYYKTLSSCNELVVYYSGSDKNAAIAAFMVAKMYAKKSDLDWWEVWVEEYPDSKMDFDDAVTVLSKSKNEKTKRSVDW